MEVHTEPTIAEAKSLSELNIHMAYIREKMNTNNEERKKDMGEIKESLRIVATNQISRSEFTAIEKIVTDNTLSIKSLLEFKNTLNGKLWGVGATAGSIVALANLLISSFLK